MIRPRSLLLASIAVSSIFNSATHAQENFYEGKEITLIVGSGPGGGYDTVSRLLARHLPRHIPGNPDITVQNMEGASGLTALNHLYNLADNDGTVIAAAANTVPFDPLLDGPAARYDAFELNWLGSSNTQLNVCFAWHDSGFNSIEDVIDRPMRVAATGATGWRAFLPALLNAAMGTQFEIIGGYSSGESMLAVENGEVEGMCADYETLLTSQQHWLENDQVVILAQFGLEPSDLLPDVPLGIDRVPDPIDRAALQLFLTQQEFGRPFVAPPGVPEDRLNILRTAFEATMTDPDFLTEAQTMGMGVDPLLGEEMSQLIASAYDTDPEVVQRLKELIQRAQPSN